MIDSLFEALSWPQRKLKESISGDELEWFAPDGMDPRAYAAGNTALDLFADPLNLIGAGLFSKGGRAIKNMVGSDAGRGMLSANLDNYIPDFYGTGGRELSRVEEALKPLVAKAKPGIPADRLGDAVVRGKNTAGAVLSGGAKAAKTLLSPSDRALWKGTGISKGGQDIIKGHMDDLANKTGSRSQAKAVAEANYQLHNAFQGGRKGPTNKGLFEVGQKSNLETYTPNEPGTISGWMNKHKGSHLDPETGKYVPVKMDDADAKYIEDYVNSAWDGSEGVVMKQPAKKASGDHRNDALGPKNPSMGGINRAFKALDDKGVHKTVSSLEDELRNQVRVRAKAVDKDSKLSNYKVLGSDETGVWIQTSKPGSAITEGGVNMLTKVKPDGEHFTVVSDKHDFLEKMPVLGKMTKEYLPNDLVAVTPPMYANVYRKPIKDAAGKKGKSPYRLSSSEIKADPNASKWDEDLMAIVNARPDARLVNAERMKNAGMLSAMGGLASDNQQE